MRPADDLRELVEAYLRALPLSSELGALEAALRYPLEAGGKRIRPVICLAVAEAAGGDPEDALPAAAALELVHTFSLVHDDLPALDDDAERRGRPSAHVAFGEGVALLAGDALLAEAFRLALSYDDSSVGRELADGTLRMIAGQYRDITHDDEDLEELHRLKTGALFEVAVALGLRVARADEEPDFWRAFGSEVGLLFQVVDDLLDGDGYVERVGEDGSRQLAEGAAERARAALDRLPVDTSVLEELVDTVAYRTG